MTTNDISATAGMRVTSSQRLLTQNATPSRSSEKTDRWIAAPTIGPRAHDRGGRTIARNGRASGPKRAHSVEEQSDGDQHSSAPEWHAHGTRHEPNWPREMQQQAQDDRAQVDKRRPHDPEVRDFRHHACLRLVASLIACHAVSRGVAAAL
jgi:hypothetical protein